MNFESFVNRKIKGTLNKWFGIEFTYRSETSKVRKLVLPYCVGKGCDIGFGGDKVREENCDSIDFPSPYTKVGKAKVDIPCDVINNEIPVPDNTYDYVYTSHLIEDFVDTKNGLEKFIRILKNGGNLVLVFPDQMKYESYCDKNKVAKNPYHIHKEMGLDYMLYKLKSITNIEFEILYKNNCEIDYNVIIVIKINKK